jgi:predicted kinase
MIHFVYGPQGAGKSTYSKRLAKEVNATCFSIDDWMKQLFGPDQTMPLDFHWILERVERCENLIWATAVTIVQTGGHVILDLGFMTAKSREHFIAKAEAQSLSFRMHYVDAPAPIRLERVMQRNKAQGETFSFEVTPEMFHFMERQFETPTAAELKQAEITITHPS